MGVGCRAGRTVGFAVALETRLERFGIVACLFVEHVVQAFLLRGCGVAGFRVQGSGFRVQGSGCRMQGSGFRVQSSGFEI